MGGIAIFSSLSWLSIWKDEGTADDIERERGRPKEEPPRCRTFLKTV
tara:strand:- start:372 stop:512 length:141 start_codon:yes stop_codon:yes gene_type:complete